MGTRYSNYNGISSRSPLIIKATFLIVLAITVWAMLAAFFI